MTTDLIASQLTNRHFLESVRSAARERALDTTARAGCDLAVTRFGKGSAPQLVGPGFAVAHSASEGAFTTAISMVLGERIRSAVAAF